MLNAKDLDYLKEKGISVEEFQKQLSYFENGVSYINLIRAATVGDGIIQLDQAEIEQYTAIFEQRDAGVQLMKFVPASGAASRMFKALYSYLQDRKSGQSTADYCLEAKDDFMLVFEKGLKKFPFYDKVKAELSANENDSEFLVSFVRTLLTENGLSVTFLELNRTARRGSGATRASSPFETSSTPESVPVFTSTRERALERMSRAPRRRSRRRNTRGTRRRARRTLFSNVNYRRHPQSTRTTRSRAPRTRRRSARERRTRVMTRRTRASRSGVARA